MKEKRILISGYEIGGQMQLLAETMRKRWFCATAVAYNDDFRGYQNDIKHNNTGARNLLGRFTFFIWALIHYDVYHFFWGVSLLNVWRFHLIDLPVLKLFKKRIIVHFRGLDVVDVRYFDYLRNVSRGIKEVHPPMSRIDQKKKLKKWLKYADVVLVSEPDLHYVVPNSILSPQVIDLSYWQPTRRPKSEEDGIIRIVHAPSSRRKKGTDFIEESVRILKDRGHRVELVMAEDLPHHRIKELYEISDIGIDQVLYGWHGKVSVELMALGKPVICNINPEFGKYRPDLPIVHASPENLTESIEQLLLDSERRQHLGQQGKNYVMKFHDVERVVDDLFSLYGIKEQTRVTRKVNGSRKW